MADEVKAHMLRLWAKRAADYLNRVAEPRGPGLGDACEYGRQFMDHKCVCGNPVTWVQVHAHANATMGREGIAP